MGKKRGKKKGGGKNKSPKKASDQSAAAAASPDASPAPVADAAAAETDASATLLPDATDAPAAPRPTLLDAAAEHEESFRQSLLSVINSVHDSDGEDETANAANAREQDGQEEEEENMAQQEGDMSHEKTNDDEKDTEDMNQTTTNEDEEQIWEQDGQEEEEQENMAQQEGDMSHEKTNDDEKDTEDMNQTTTNEDEEQITGTDVQESKHETLTDDNIAGEAALDEDQASVVEEEPVPATGTAEETTLEEDISAIMADDATVPHSNSIEVSSVGNVGEDNLPDLPDEPIITTSFGSDDELNNASALPPDGDATMIDGRDGIISGGEDTNSSNKIADDEDAVASSIDDDESASLVTSDFTLGGYSAASSKDSAIAALASLSTDPQGDTTVTGSSVAPAAGADGSISPLHLTKGVSAEEGEQDININALPPLDTSADVSPEISLAGSATSSRSGDKVHEDDDDEAVSSDADDELDREIDISLGAVEGLPSPSKTASNLQDGDSAGIEAGSNAVQGEKEEGNDGASLGSSSGTDSSDEDKAGATVAAAAVLGTAGVALGAAAIATDAGEGQDALASTGKVTAAPVTTTDTSTQEDDTGDNADPIDSPDETKDHANDEADASEIREDTAAEDADALPKSDNAEESEPNNQDGAGDDADADNNGDNPFESFVSEEAAADDDAENDDKEWVSSVLAAGAAASGAAVLATDAGTENNLDTVPASSSTDVDGSDANTDGSPISGAEKECSGDESEDSNDSDNLAVAVVAAAAIGAGVASAANASSDEIPVSDAARDSSDITKKTVGAAGDEQRDGSASESATKEPTASRSPDTKLANESMGSQSRGSMDSGPFYSRGTFSEDEDDNPTNDEAATGALAAAGIAAGVAGVAGVAAGTAEGPLQPAPEHTPKEEEFTVISSPSKSMTGESPTKALLEEDDIEKGMSDEAPPVAEAGSFAAASSPSGSANDPSPKQSRKKKKNKKEPKNDRKKQLLMAAGALALVGGIVGIALALTLGRGEKDKGSPATPSPTPAPFDPTPPVTSRPSPQPSPGPTVTPGRPSAAPVTSKPISGSPTLSPIEGSVPPPPTTDSPSVSPQSDAAPTPAPQSDVPTLATLTNFPTSTPQSNVPTQPPMSSTPTSIPQSVVPTQSRPTMIPTSLEYAETFQGLQTYFADIVPNPDALEDPGSPQYEATSWLASDLVAKGISRRMLQESSAEEEITIRQRYTLATLWFATGGSNWTISAESADGGWLSPGPECGWEGVICSRHTTAKVRSSSPDEIPVTLAQSMNSHLRGRRRMQESSSTNSTLVPTAQTSLVPTPSPSTVSVEASELIVSGLELDESNLIGEVPADMMLLSGLKYFAASNQELTSIPSELGELSQLERLYLNNNAIGGSIATELGSLLNLIDLRLNDNHLEGEIPSALGNLISLDSLELHHNDLSGTMPDFVCSLLYVGEDDVLDRLTSDCAGDPPKVECDCCTECYAGTESATLLDETNPPTPSPTAEIDTMTGGPTETPTTALGDSPPTATTTNTSAPVEKNPNLDVVESFEEEDPVPETSEELIGDAATADAAPGAREEIQNVRGRDSNDVYEALYGEQSEVLAQKPNVNSDDGGAM